MSFILLFQSDADSGTNIFTLFLVSFNENCDQWSRKKDTAAMFCLFDEQRTREQYTNIINRLGENYARKGENKFEGNFEKMVKDIKSILNLRNLVPIYC